jgi:hypothetical protein
MGILAQPRITNDFFIASGVGLSPLYCGHFRPIVPAPDDRWGWLWSNWWNEDWQGKPKYSEKTRPSATLFTTNPTWTDPGRRGRKTATNCLSYGAALWCDLLQLRDYIFNLLSIFRRNKVGIWDHLPSMDLCIAAISFRIPDPVFTVFMKLGMYIMGPVRRVFHKSLQSVCVSLCLALLSLLGSGSVYTLPRQRIHTAIE